MKKILFFLIISNIFNPILSQNKAKNMINDSILVENNVEFFIYDGPYGTKENIKQPAIKFILSVTNLGTKPIPDLSVSNRSEFVNFIVNDTVQNPVSMYNGSETLDKHILKKNETDNYIWWIFENETYGKIFTVKWQYLNLYTKTIKVDVKNKKITNY